MTSFRETVWALSPPRLRASRAARLAYAFIGLPLDQISEAANQAVKVRFPSDCPEDALGYHSRDRGVRRGPLEPSLSFRTRLLLWLEMWRGAGVGRAMLDQIAGYLTPQPCRMRIWTQVGLVYTREVDGTFTVGRGGTAWNWDGRASLWARFWLVLYSPDGVPWSRAGTLGDGQRLGESLTATLGSTATTDQVQSIRAIVDDLKPAPSLCRNIIVSFDATAFAPTDTAPPLPDGTWGRWGKNVGSTMRKSRDDRAIYWRGV